MMISIREAFLAKKPQSYSCDYFPMSIDQTSFDPRLIASAKNGQLWNDNKNYYLGDNIYIDSEGKYTVDMPEEDYGDSFIVVNESKHCYYIPEKDFVAIFDYSEWEEIEEEGLKNVIKKICEGSFSNGEEGNIKDL